MPHSHSRRSFLTHVSAGALAAAAFAVPAGPAAAADNTKRVDVEPIVTRGLEWLSKNQKPDGHWEAPGGQYPTVCTGLAGIALLMEGSTMREGKYSDNVKNAVDWYLTRSQSNGLLGTPNNPTESSYYIYGHGFGMLFLACAYGEEDDARKRKQLEAVLKKAVEFSGKAQTKQGGWGYVSSQDGGGFDEGSTTITQLQGLRAARNAGIPVPKSIIDNATDYLRKATTPNGGVIYNLGPGGAQAMNGQERPAITAAAVACAFSSGKYDDPYAKKWIKYCKQTVWQGGQSGHDDYQTYYWAQCVYVLGEDRYEMMFPEDKAPIKWSKYRDRLYESIKSRQSSDGNWGGGFDGNGTILTSWYLCLLQLEKGILPFYQR